MHSKDQQKNCSLSNSRKFLAACLAGLSILGLSSCGGENVNDNIDFTINPTVPFLRLQQGAYLDLKGDVQTVSEPWTSFYFTIINNHPSRTLVIEAIVLTFTGNKNGFPVTKEVVANLSSANCPDGATRLSFARIDPGFTFTGDTDCDNTPSGTETWYFSSLPDSDTTSYTISIQAVGYYADPATPEAPIDRVDKLLFSSTR